MGRKAATPKARVEKADERTRVRLTVAKQEKTLAEKQLENASRKLQREIEKAQEKGLSLRDVAAVLQIPHTRIHHWLKPYRREEAA